MTEPTPPTPLRRIPLVPLRDDVVFPKLIVPLSVGRRTSIAAITSAMDRDKQVLLTAQKDPQVDETGEADLYSTGTIAEINGMRQTPAGIQMLVAGSQRARIVRFTQFTPFIEVEVEPISDVVGEGLELEAHMRSVKSLYQKYVDSGATVAPGNSIDKNELHDYLREHLAPHKTPRHWFVVDLALARPVGVEQCQLASARVAAHQGEVVLARDHVHPEVALEELGDRIAVRDPECDMVEGLRLHGARII